MELLFKAYADKPSRLGIKYPYAYQAQKEYEAFFTKCGGAPCSLKIETLQGKLQLILTAEHNDAKFIHKNIEYKTELLRKLILHINQKLSFEFVHVYMDENKPFVVKPYQKVQFVTLSKIEVIGSENFEYLQ